MSSISITAVIGITSLILGAANIIVFSFKIRQKKELDVLGVITGLILIAIAFMAFVYKPECPELPM